MSLTSLILASVMASAACISDTMTILVNDTMTISMADIWQDIAKDFTTMEVKGKGASIVDFVESYVTDSMANTTYGGRIGAWKVDREQNLLHVVGGGEYIVYKMSMDQDGRPQVEKIKSHTVSQYGQVCYGLAVAKNFTVVGCGSSLSVNLTVIIGDKMLPQYQLNYSNMKFLNYHIRIEVSRDYRFLSVYDGTGRDQRFAKHVTVIYFASIDETGDIQLINHALSYDDGKRFLGVRGAQIMGETGNYSILASLVNIDSGNFDLLYCNFTPDLVNMTVNISGCQEKGVAALSINNGDVNFWFSDEGNSLEIVSLFSENDEHVLMFCGTKPGFEVSTCKRTSEALPLRKGMFSTLANIFYIDMYDIPNREFSVELYSSVDFKMLSLFRIRPNASETSLSFDYFKDEFSVGSLCFAGKRGGCSGAFLFYYSFMKVYYHAPIADSYLEIQGSEIEGGSSVFVVQGIIGHGATAVKAFRVNVMQDVYSLLDITEDAAKISGLAGTTFTTPIQRSWFKGNDVRFQVHVDSPSSVKISNDDPISYSFDVNDKWSQMFVFSEHEIVARSKDGVIYYFGCEKAAQHNYKCSQLAKDENMKDYRIVDVTSDVPFPDVKLSLYLIITAKNVFGNYTVGAVKRNQPSTTSIQWALLEKNSALRSVLVTSLYDQTIILAVHERPNQDQLKTYKLTLPVASMPITIEDLAIIDEKSLGLPVRFLGPNNLRKNALKPEIIDMLLRNGYLLQLKIDYDSTTKKFSFLYANKIWFGRSDLVLQELPVDYCNLGREFFVWDSKFRIFSKSVNNDTSQYILRLTEMGIGSIKSISCLTESSSIVIWGLDLNGGLLSATIFGNMHQDSHSRVHTVTQYSSIIGEKASVSVFSSFQVPHSAIHHIVVANDTLYARRTLLSGPQIEMTVSDDADSRLTLLTMSTKVVGRSSELITEYLTVDSNVQVKKTKQSTLVQGRNNLDAAVYIQGHLIEAEVRVPDELKDVVTFEGRHRMTESSARGQGFANEIGLINSTILASSVNCTAYYGVSNVSNYNTLLMRGKVCNRDVSMITFSSVILRGKIQDDKLILVGVFRKGPNLHLGVMTIAFDSAKPVAFFDSEVSVSSVSALAIVTRDVAKSPTDLTAIIRVDSSASCDMYALSSQGSKSQFIGRIDQCADFWSIETTDSNGFIYKRTDEFTKLRIATLNYDEKAGYYSLDKLDVDFEGLQPKSITCKENLNKTAGCAVSTHGVKSFRLDVSFFQSSGRPWVKEIQKSSYFNFVKSHKEGTFIGEDVAEKFIAFKALDGSIIVYRTTENPKGYLYTLISPTDNEKLEASRLDRQEYRTFSLQQTGQEDSYPKIEKLCKSESYTNNSEFQLQPMTLVITKPIKNSQAERISIRLSASQETHEFSIYSFYSSLNGGQKEDYTGWSTRSWFIVIFLSIVLAVFILWFVCSFIRLRKDDAIKQGSYQTEDRGSGTNVDEKLSGNDINTEGRRTLQS